MNEGNTASYPDSAESNEDTDIDNVLRESEALLDRLHNRISEYDGTASLTSLGSLLANSSIRDMPTPTSIVVMTSDPDTNSNSKDASSNGTGNSNRSSSSHKNKSNGNSNSNSNSNGSNSTNAPSKPTLTNVTNNPPQPTKAKPKGQRYDAQKIDSPPPIQKQRLFSQDQQQLQKQQEEEMMRVSRMMMLSAQQEIPAEYPPPESPVREPVVERWEKVSSATAGDDDFVPMVDYTKETRKSVPKPMVAASTKLSRVEAYRRQNQRRRKRRRRIGVVVAISLITVYWVWSKNLLAFNRDKNKSPPVDVEVFSDVKETKTTRIETSIKEVGENQIDVDDGINIVEEISFNATDPIKGTMKSGDENPEIDTENEDTLSYEIELEEEEVQVIFNSEVQEDSIEGNKQVNEKKSNQRDSSDRMRRGLCKHPLARVFMKKKCQMLEQDETESTTKLLGNPVFMVI